jgi:hypothetical protein
MQHFAQLWLGLQIDLSIKSLLLSAVAGLALFAFRIRDTNLRHRVWTAVMMGMLALPALEHLTPAIPLPSWLTVGISPTAVDSRQLGSQSDSAPVAVSPPIAAEEDREFRSASRFDADSDPLLSPRSPAPVGSQSATRSDPPPHKPTENPTATAPRRTVETIAKQWPLVLAGLYVAVAAFFAMRLVIGLMLSYRLVRRAREITLPTVGNGLRAVLSGSGSMAPSGATERHRGRSLQSLRILESDAVYVPATLGFLHPVVLLPIAWRTWSETKLQAVLAHELAHVRRADWLVITLAEFNRALYWFHPLAWFLRRRLSELAEQNCDDAVLEDDGDRTQYARHLLEVATSFSAAGARYRPPLSGVAMARKPNVETRIDAILDAGRPLARRLGTVGAIVLLLCGATAVLLAAALRTAADEAPKKPAAEMEMKALAKNEIANARAKESTPQQSRPAGIGSRAVAHRVIHGRIVGVDGKPAAGADIAVIAWRKFGVRSEVFDPSSPVLAEGETDSAGRFRIELAGDWSATHRDANLIARASGSGLAWRKFSFNSADVEVSIELQPEQTISGRLVDVEGQPAAGVRLNIAAVMRQADINEWLSATWAGDVSINHLPAVWPQPIESDREGRFVIHGISKSCGVEIFTQGDERFARQLVHLNTGMPEQSTEGDPSYHIPVKNFKLGGDAVLVLAPAQLFAGAVRFEDTGQLAPNSGVSVGSRQQEGHAWLETAGVADENGRYRINPFPGIDFGVYADPPAHTPYLARAIRFFPWKAGDKSKEVNVTLPRGVLVKGRIVEQGSEAPIAGAYVQYRPGEVNTAENIKWPDLRLADGSGQFEIAVPPGPGCIIVRAPRDQYVFLETNDRELLRGQPGERRYAHGIERIDPAPNAAPLTLDFHLKRGAIVRGELVDEQGTPIEEAAIISRLNVRIQSLMCNASPAEATGGRFEFSALAPDQKYPVQFLDAKRRLGATTTIKAGMPSPRVVLKPCGSAKMRFVDQMGQPLARFEPRINLVVTPGAFQYDRSVRTGDAVAADTVPVRIADRLNYPQPLRADDNGRLTLSALIPGATYQVVTRMIVFAKEFRATVNETIDLGDITVDTAKILTLDENRSVIHGRIAGVDGKPAAGVDVAVIARRTEMGRGGDLGPTGAVLAEAKTDADGAYRIELAGISSKTHRDANIIARSNGTAIAWRKLNLDAGDVETSFELQPEETIAGRLVDIEGQPAAVVRFQVGGVSPRVAKGNQSPTEGIGLYGSFTGLRLPAAWPEQIVTGVNGRFVVHGIPKGYGVYLEVEGNDRFAPQGIHLNSGMAEQRGERDGTYRPLIKNFKPGEEAVLPLAPAQLFNGTVRYEDTGEPAPHARLTIWSSQEKFGSMFSLPGKANEKGEYRISANPGIRFGVAAYPPDDAPYLVRQINDISWEHGEKSKVVDVALPRGVLVHGKVLEGGSDAPIAGASVQYHAEAANNTNKSDSILTGWQDIHLTDKEGRFSIVVLPGPGRLLVHAPNETYVLKETSGQELYKGKPGGERNYAHAIERIDIAANATPPEIVIRLQRGATVRGELVDQEGKPVEAVEMFSRLHIDPRSLWWRGFGVEAKGGRFEVSGLAPDREYPVYFLDSKRRRGATVMIQAGMPPPRVVLQACSAAAMRFVDDQGKPVAKQEPDIELVVTPGRLRYSTDKMDADKLAADADFIANVDRANHSLPEKSGEDGRLTVSALIPGANYHLITYAKQKFVLAKEFKAVANEMIDLGDITVERKE